LSKTTRTELNGHMAQNDLGHLGAPAARGADFFEIVLTRTSRGSRGAAARLYGEIRTAILDGRLSDGSKLPATRQAAAVLGVSRNTAAGIYDRLINEGLVEARQGSGTYVSAPRGRRTAPVPLERPPELDFRLNAFWASREVAEALGFWRAGAQERPGPDGPVVDLRPAVVDLAQFPFDTFRAVLTRQLRRLERQPAPSRSPHGHQGNFRLRDAIARHIALTRAVSCQPQDLLVTSGAQQAFDLLARILVKPGGTLVAVENPGYPPLRVCFAAMGAQIVPVRVDEEGLVVADLPSGVGIICVCPSHQFPLGVTMSRRRRDALVAYARQHNTVIVEDDYDGEFRYGEPLSALHSPETADLVFYVGTFSKCMFQALRLGYVVAPPWAMPSLVSAKNGTDWHSSGPLQLGTGAFIAAGHLRRHVRQMRNIYAQRREVLASILSRDFPELLILPSFYGLHVTAIARCRLDLDAVTRRLAGEGVMLHSLQRYFCGPASLEGLVLGYGAADFQQIRLGLGALRRALSGRAP
jgi:GntR family transcriptional regulator/MocR family aminotransferase